MLRFLFFILPLAMASSLETVSLRTPGGGRFNCSASGSPRRVRFQEIVVAGLDGTKKMYQRFTPDEIGMRWAVNFSTALDASDFATCARLAGKGGFEAFSAGEVCTGYKLHGKFCSCSEGEDVLFVRRDFIAGRDSVMPLADGEPYPSVFVNISGSAVPLDMLVPPTVDVFGGVCAETCAPFPPMTFEEFGASNLSSTVLPSSEPGATISYVILINQEVSWLFILAGLYDVVSTRTASSCGMPALRPVEFSTKITMKYFLEECGNAITMGDTQYVLVHSHKGFGGDYFPSDVPYDCTVTISCPTCQFLPIHSDMYLYSENPDCGGYSLTAFYPGNNTAGFDLCRETGYPAALLGPPVNHQVVLKGSPTSDKNFFGFAFTLHVHAKK